MISLSPTTPTAKTTPLPARSARAATRRPAAWLIGGGAVVNVLIFVTASALALFHAARNALAAHFVVVALVTACTVVAAVRLFVVLRRGHSQRPLPGPCERIVQHERIR